jgi:hypothetical protein
VTWWRERQALRLAAGKLTQEFAALNVEGVGFRVRAHGHRSLQLLVWPDGGSDNFVIPAHGVGGISGAAEELRRIVALYAVGQRPPFT